MSENNLPPEDVVLQEWLTRSERKLLFVVWYVRDLALLVEIRTVLERLRKLEVDFHVEFIAINEHLKLAVKLGVKNEVTVLMFKDHELLELIGPEPGVTKLLRILGKYV